MDQVISQTNTKMPKSSKINIDYESDDEDNITLDEPCKCTTSWDIRCRCDPALEPQRFAKCPMKVYTTLFYIQNNVEFQKKTELLMRTETHEIYEQYASAEPYCLTRKEQDDLIEVVELEEATEDEWCCVECGLFIPADCEDDCDWREGSGTEGRFICWNCTPDDEDEDEVEDHNIIPFGKIYSNGSNCGIIDEKIYIPISKIINDNTTQRMSRYFDIPKIMNWEWIAEMFSFVLTEKRKGYSVDPHSFLENIIRPNLKKLQADCNVSDMERINFEDTDVYFATQIFKYDKVAVASLISNY